MAAKCLERLHSATELMDAAMWEEAARLLAPMRRCAALSKCAAWRACAKCSEAAIRRLRKAPEEPA